MWSSETKTTLGQVVLAYLFFFFLFNENCSLDEKNHFIFTENPLSSAKSDLSMAEWDWEELRVLGDRLQ